MTPAPSFRSSFPVLLAVFLLALGLRLAYVLALRDSPFFAGLTVDSQWHDEWAWNWARGADLEGAFFRAPLYPLWLSGIYAVFGHDLMAARVVQAVLGALTAALIAGAGLRWGGRGLGLAAGVLTAVYGTLLFFDGELLVPNLLVLLLAAGLFLLAGRSGIASRVLAGACLGLAAVARPNAVILVPLVSLWVFREPGVPASQRRFAGLGVLVLGLLPFLAVSAVNTAREGAWTGPATHGGVNFYAGNHSGATGKSVEIPELRNILSWRQFQEQAETVAEKDAGRPLGSQEVSDWWLRRGVRWILEHPREAAGLYLRKMYYLVNGFEIPSNRDLYGDRRGPLRWLLGALPFLVFPWGIVFPLALTGFVGGWRDPRHRHLLVLLGAWVVLYSLTLLPFFITARFRMGLLPPLVLLAAHALVHVRSWVRRPGPVGVLIAALLVSNSSLADVRAGNPAQEAARLADAHLRGGETERALGELEDAYRADPRDMITAGLLAEAYLRASRPRDAIPLLRRMMLARPGDPGTRFRLGTAYLSLEEYEAAANVLETVVEMDPGNAAAWVNLGVASEGRYRLDRAAEAYAQGIALAPTEELAYLHLARIHRERDRWDEAVEVLSRGVEKNPGSFSLHLSLAEALSRTGDRSGALREVKRALEIEPGSETARALRTRLESGP